MILAVFLLLVCSISALQHAYMEALMHKAFDPLFGKFFLQEFLSKNTFALDKVSVMDFKMWNIKAAQKASSAWPLKLGVKNFEPLLQMISMTVSNWMEVLPKEESMVHSDVVEECASKCKLICESLCANISVKGRLNQVALNEAFLYLVFEVQVVTKTAQLHQLHYFEVLNNAVEQMERTYIDIRKYQVSMPVYNYDKISELAKMLLKDSSKDSNPSPTRSVRHAKEALRIVNRFNKIPKFDSYSKENEEAMICVCSELHTFSTNSLKTWTKAETIVENILNLKVFPPAVKSIEFSSHNISAESFFSLPLSIMREIEAVANDMTLKEIMEVLKACEEYRKISRLLDDFHRRAKETSASEENTMSLEIQRTLIQMRSRRLPQNLMSLFTMHVYIMINVSRHVLDAVHFSNIPALSEGAGIGLEREYLQNFAYWINNATKFIPKEQLERHFQSMLQLITLEVNCMIPEDERKLVMMTLMLMIDGGLRAYFNY